MKQLENSLRIKVLGVCNRNCRFCHQEGSMGMLEEIQYTEELGTVINTLSAEFGIYSVAITGGEPLLHSDLLELVRNLSKKTKIQQFSLTTNGTVVKDYDYWKEFVSLGLRKVNLSMPDLLTTIRATGENRSITVYQNQIETICILNKLGIIPNINIVVYNDKKYLTNILNVLFHESQAMFTIALLPDLTDESTFAYSQTIISEIINEFNFSIVQESHRKGTSNTVCDYKTDKGILLQVKTTKQSGGPKRLNALCSKCNHYNHCQEGFYGLRLEKCNSKYYIRLCLYRSDSEVLLTLNDFLKSPVYDELKEIWQ